MKPLLTRVALTVLAIAVGTLGCTKGSHESRPPVTFVTKYAPIEFSFPAGWNVNPKEHPFDLQCLSEFNTLNTGVFAYEEDDLVEGAKPLEILMEQVEDLKSKRSNMEEMEPLQRHDADDKTITSVTYIGSRDGSRNCYRFTLIEFASSGRIAIVLQVGLPEEWKKSKPILEKITQSAKSLAETEAAPEEAPAVKS